MTPSDFTRAYPVLVQESTRLQPDRLEISSFLLQAFLVVKPLHIIVQLAGLGRYLILVHLSDIDIGTVYGTPPATSSDSL